MCGCLCVQAKENGVNLNIKCFRVFSLSLSFWCIQFCGTTIAGLSLLSDSVMRLVHEEEKTDWVDLFLPQRSLYILR